MGLAENIRRPIYPSLGPDYEPQEKTGKRVYDGGLMRRSLTETPTVPGTLESILGRALKSNNPP